MRSGGCFHFPCCLFRSLGSAAQTPFPYLPQPDIQVWRSARVGVQSRAVTPACAAVAVTPRCTVTRAQPSGTEGRAVLSRVPAPLGTQQEKGGDEVSAAAGKQQTMMPGQGPGCWGRGSCVRGWRWAAAPTSHESAGKRGSLGQV